MEILDDVGKKITEISQSVAKKAKDMAETGNLRLQVREEERALKSIYTELGKKYYAVHGENPDPIMADVVGKIEESKKKIDLLKENIAKIENEKICPNCGTKMPEKGMFCPTCGQKYPEAETETEADEVVEEPKAADEEPVEEPVAEENVPETEESFVKPEEETEEEETEEETEE